MLFRSELFFGSEEVQRGCRNYIGSVTADATGSVIATSSPVGNQVVYWDAASGRSLGVTHLADGCGVAPLAPKRFVLSSGMGALVHAGPGSEIQPILSPATDLAWDNHFRRL